MHTLHHSAVPPGLIVATDSSLIFNLRNTYIDLLYWSYIHCSRLTVYYSLCCHPTGKLLTSFLHTKRVIDHCLITTDQYHWQAYVVRPLSILILSHQIFIHTFLKPKFFVMYSMVSGREEVVKVNYNWWLYECLNSKGLIRAIFLDLKKGFWYR